MKRLGIVAGLLIFFAGGLWGQTYTWVGPSGGVWNTPANWSPSGVPGSGDIAEINTDIAVLDSNITVGELQIGGAGRLNLASFNLTVEGNVAVSGTLDMTGRTLTVGGNWNSSSNVYATGSTVVFNGTTSQSLTGTAIFQNITVNNSGPGVVTGAPLNLNGSLLLQAGTLTAASAYSINVAGSVTISAGSTLNPNGNNLTAGSLVLNNTAVMGTAGTLTVNGTANIGSNITTTGNQTYTGAVTLTNDVTFTGGGYRDWRDLGSIWKYGNGSNIGPDIDDSERKRPF